MDIPRNATPGPSSLLMQPSGSGLHTAQPDPQIGPTGPVQRIAQSDSAQSSLTQSDNHSVSVNMNSNTASSSVVSLPPDTGRYHILPPSHVQSFSNHPLPPSPPRFAAYMCRDPLLPSPSPPPQLSAPIQQDTPPHLHHTPLPTYTGPQAPHLRHLHLPAIHPMPDPCPPVPQQPQQVPAGAVQPLSVPPPQPVGALPPQSLGVLPPHYVAPVMPPYPPPFPHFVLPLPQYAPPPPVYAPYGHQHAFTAYPYPPYLPFLPYSSSSSSFSVSRSLPTTTYIPILNGSSDFASWHKGVWMMIRHLGGFSHIASL